MLRLQWVAEGEEEEEARQEASKRQLGAVGKEMLRCCCVFWGNWFGAGVVCQFESMWLPTMTVRQSGKLLLLLPLVLLLARLLQQPQQQQQPAKDDTVCETGGAGGGAERGAGRDEEVAQPAVR